MEVSDEESVTGPFRPLDTDSETEQPDPAAAPDPRHIDGETVADLARLLDSDSERPDPAAARGAIVPYLGDIDRYMRSLEVRGFSIPLLVRSCVWRRRGGQGMTTGRHRKISIPE